MQNGREADRSIPYVSLAFFPSLKQNFIAYRSSNVSSRPDCIFEIHHLWQSGFSIVYSNCCCSSWFESEIIKIGLSSLKMYSNNILNCQESTTILNACTKNLETYWMHHVYVYTYMQMPLCFHIYSYIHTYICHCVFIHTYIHTYICHCAFMYMSIYTYILMSLHIYIYIYIYIYIALLCNVYNCRKSLTMLFAFYFTLMPLGKTWVHLFLISYKGK